MGAAKIRTGCSMQRKTGNVMQRRVETAPVGNDEGLCLPSRHAFVDVVFGFARTV